MKIVGLDTPLLAVSRRRKTTPESWHAQVLSEEISRLGVAVRSLEYAMGFDTGRHVGRVENVLADKLTDPGPGAAVVAANPGT